MTRPKFQATHNPQVVICLSCGAAIMHSDIQSHIEEHGGNND